MKKVKMITDGACLGNPGPGGWAVILRSGGCEKEIFGSSPHTTNNRMELAAAMEGFRALKEPCDVEVVTDSEYVKKGITEWIHAWKRRGWRTAGKQPVLNQDLWKRLDQLASPHTTEWVWTRGHASHADNNRADELAAAAAHDQSFSNGYAPAIQSSSYDVPPANGDPASGLRTKVREHPSKETT